MGFYEEIISKNSNSLTALSLLNLWLRCSVSSKNKSKKISILLRIQMHAYKRVIFQSDGFSQYFSVMCVK